MTVVPSAGEAMTRFAFEHMPVRGAIVQLGPSWDTILERNRHASVAATLLGEACVASALMFSNIKLSGRISLQLQGGTGPLALLLAQADSEGKLRGVVRMRDEQDTVLSERSDFRTLTSGATLAITLERHGTQQRYQGIVPLDGDSLAEALQAYFAQSEQLPTRLWLAATPDSGAAGLLLQRLPGTAEDDDGWNRALQLAETITTAELTSLEPDEILHRLYHRETLRRFDPTPLGFGCSCSRERVAAVLRSLGEAELAAAAAGRGFVDVDCEFCNENYRFDAVDLGQLFSEFSVGSAPKTRQ